MIYITLSSSMLWQDASEDDYDVDATETAFTDAFNRALYKAGYDDVQINWGMVVSMEIEDDDGKPVQDNRYHDIYHIMNSVDPIFIERQDSIEDFE